MFDWLRNIFKTEENDSLVKYLIVGLGNIGSEYESTRHNIGFLAADKIAEELNVSFKDDSFGKIAHGKHKGRQIYIQKPNTFMNLSGKAVHHWMQKLKIPQENVIILLDDLHLDFGAVRLKGKGSDAGHNGLKSINQLLGNTKYARLKIGIGKDFPKGRQSEYVLGEWSKTEQTGLPEVIEKSSKIALSFCAIGLQFTMSNFNNK